MAQVPITPLKSNVGLLAQSPVTTPASIMPSGTAYSIPSGTLAAGDRVHCEFYIVRRGAQNTQSITIDAKVGATSIIGNQGTASSANVIKIVMEIVCVSGTSQAVSATWFFGTTFSGAQNTAVAVNTGTTALTIDCLAAFGAAATDTLGLENFTIQRIAAA